jgi:sugar phosphate permease
MWQKVSQRMKHAVHAQSSPHRRCLALELLLTAAMVVVVAVVVAVAVAAVVVVVHRCCVLQGQQQHTGTSAPTQTIKQAS